MRESETQLRALLDRARRGDREAQGELLDRFRPQLCQWARGRIEGKLRARLDESDLAQRSCISALRNFGRFEGDDLTQFAAWLHVIHEQNVRDAIRDHAVYRKRAVSQECSDREALDDAHEPSASPSQQAMRVERSAQIAEVLETLPDGQREAVRLRHLEGCSLAEIGRRLDRTEAAVAGLLKRGLAKLREKLKD